MDPCDGIGRATERSLGWRGIALPKHHRLRHGPQLRSLPLSNLRNTDGADAVPAETPLSIVPRHKVANVLAVSFLSFLPCSVDPTNAQNVRELLLYGIEPAAKLRAQLFRRR